MKRNAILILSFLALLFSIGGLYFARTVNSQDITPQSAQAVESPTNTLFSYQGQLMDTSGNPINNAAMPMTFKLYNVLSGGTVCWSENQSVSIQNGQFNVLIGQITAISASCLTGDIYLEIVVSGETLTPRELLTSTAHAVEASSLPHNATTGGSINIAPGPDGEGGQIRLVQGDTGNEWFVDNRLGTFRLFHDNQIYFSIDPTGATEIEGPLNLNNNLSTPGIVTPFAIMTERPWQFEQEGTGSGTTTVLRSTTDSKNFRFLNEDGSPILSIRALNGGGSVTVHEHLFIGSCSTLAALDGDNFISDATPSCSGGSLTTGAIIEANLQSPEEVQLDTIERFELGDLLCWATDVEQLEKCDTANNRLVMAVANHNGKPVVMGAEPIKVIGPVQAGDILVTSNIPGYAMVNNNPAPGTVIGQALEDLNGESGVIKAMIRKW